MQIQEIKEATLTYATHSLESLSDGTKEYLGKSRSSNTKRAYRSDWNHFTQFCEMYDLDALPAKEDTVAMYITSLAKINNLKVSTISRRLSAISQAHEAAAYEVPITQKVKMVLSGIMREKGSKQRGKEPILVDMIIEMCGHTDDNLKGIRDKALLLIGFTGAFRRSELVGIDYDHLSFSARGVLISIPFSKGDQEGEGQVIGIPFGKRPATCPVKALSAWCEASKKKEGPLFCRINRHGHMGNGRLSDRAVSLIVKEYAEKCGYDPKLFSGHSLRKGLATSAAMAGKSERSIMSQTRHQSERMVRKYIRMATVFEENAANDIGL